MTRTITVSLPVSDLKASKAFYTALGFKDNPQFAGFGADSAAFMMLSETIYVVLLTHEKWSSLTDRPIPPKTSSEVALNISCDTKEEVDAMIKVAGELGGIPDINPIDDYPFMYGRDFADPDGHIWGPKWMDMSAMPAGE